MNKKIYSAISGALIAFGFLVGNKNIAFGDMSNEKFTGVCGSKWSTVKEERQSRKEELENTLTLADQIVRDKNLYIQKVQGRFGGYKRADFVSLETSETKTVADPSEEKAIPMNDAVRADHLHSQVSQKEWGYIVELWANIIRAAAYRVHSLPHQNYCGPLDTTKALLLDSTRILWYPFWAYQFKDGWGGGENRPWIKDSLVFTAGTAPSLVSDVGLAIPSAILSTRDKLVEHPSHDVKRFTKAVSEFQNTLQRLEKRSSSQS